MNLFKNLFTKNTKKAQSSENIIQQKSMTGFYDPSGVFSTDGNSLTENGYELNSNGYASVNIIIKAITQMKMYVSSKDNKEPLGDGHPLQMLLNNPDDDQGQNQFVTEYFTYLLVLGLTYIYKIAPENGANAGRPMKLKTMSAEYIEDVVSQMAWGEEITGYNFKKKKDLPVKKDEILRDWLFSPNSQIEGLSPLMPAGLSVDFDNETNRWNVSLLQNGVNPSGIYTFEGELDEQQFRRLQEQFAESSGSGNAGKQKIMESGGKFQQTGITPKDADFLAGQTHAKREIASVYNIAPQLIGDTASQTFANYEQAILSLHNDVAFPFLEGLVEKLNNWITPFYGDDVIIRIDTSKVEALNSQKKADWERIDKSDTLTINEKREMKGFEAVDNGDVIIIGNQTLEQIIEGQPAPSMPAKPEGSTEDDKPDEDETEDDKKSFSENDYIALQYKEFNQSEDNAIDESKLIIDKYFDNQLKELMLNIKGLTDAGQISTAVDAVLMQTTPSLKAVYEMIYKEIAFDNTLEARKNYRTFAKKQLGVFDTKEELPDEFTLLKDFKTEFGSFVDAYFVQIKLADLVQNVNDYTRSQIGVIVTNSAKEGLSIFETSKNIQSLYGNDFKLWRAERIARTEGLRAMSFAQHEAQVKVNPLVKKAWLDSHDSRVRPQSTFSKKPRKSKKLSPFNHRVADQANGYIDLNASFKVSNESLLFPRDTSGGASAGNVINCRCTVVYKDELEELFN